MGANVTRLLECAAWVGCHDPDAPEFSASDERRMTWERDLREAVTELQAAAPRLSATERLERCRDRAAAIVSRGGFTVGNGERTEEDNVASAVEDLAHAMLAAERPPSPPDIRDDPPAYNLAHRHGQASGAARALGALVEMTALRTPDTSLTMAEIREWAERMRKVDWSDGDVKAEG